MRAGIKQAGIVQAGITREGIHAGITRGAIHAGITRTRIHDGITRGGIHAGITRTRIHDGITRGGIHAGITRTRIHEGITRAGIHAGITRTRIHDGITRAGIHAASIRGGILTQIMPGGLLLELMRGRIHAGRIRGRILAGFSTSVRIISVLLGTVFLFGLAQAAQDTGYPAGLMADCPGMNRSTTFSAATRRSLSVVVARPAPARGLSLFGPLGDSSERTCPLSAAGAACAANHLDLRNRKTMVLISGYMDASFSPLVRTLSAAYLRQGRNVVIVEIFPVLVRSYPIAARVTKPLGAALGEFLAELVRRGLTPGRLRLVGGSLGAHVAAFAARELTRRTGRRPKRLTGLDPAGPCFRSVPPSERLHAAVADHVDVLHTNIDGFGLADAVGHVDFYANGGEYQPAMVGNFILPCFLVCSHVRAALYWVLAETNPDKFVAARCDSVSRARHGDCYRGAVTTNLLGPKTNFSQPGVYYLPTDELPPYYLGDKGLKQREYGVNTYLTKTAPDEDLVV